MVELTNRKSTEEWLKEQPREVIVAFATRCALRALPMLGSAGPEAFGRTVLPSCRAMLTSGGAALVSTPEVRGRASAAADAADAAAAYAARAAAANAADAASAYAAAYAARAAAAYADAAVGYADAAALADESGDLLTDESGRPLNASSTVSTSGFYWSAVSADTEAVVGATGGDAARNLFATPLWPAQVPKLVSEAMTALDAHWTASPQFWRFWKEWYDGMLAGQPIHWKLQESIALISDEIWKEGPERVAVEIDRIRKEFHGSPIDKATLERQISLLLDHADCAAGGTSALAQQIEDAITQFMREAEANTLPDGFGVLDRLPNLLRRIAVTIPAARDDADRIAELEAQLQEYASELKLLRAELAAALAEPKPSVFPKVWQEQAAKSLGDWKLYGALATGTWVLLGAPTAAETLSGINALIDSIFAKPPVAIPPTLPPTTAI